MGILEEIPNVRGNLANLQSESLKVIALFTGAIGYVGLMFLIWPVSDDLAPVGSWTCSILLIGSGIISYTLHSRHLHIATHLLVWGILGTIAGVVLAFQSLDATYLFILPIIFAGVLLGPGAMLLATTVACLFILTIGVTHMGPAWYVADVALPFVIITLVSAASWLSARNLYIALSWVWSGYERAHQNEQIARERQAGLRRTLKALDEATYRLERANYMLAAARDQAEEASRLKQQFAQTISHELRTPLNLIVGFTELMVQSPEYYGSQLPFAYVRDLSIVHRNACHLRSLVSDVLDLARIRAAQMHLLPEETDFSILVRETVNTARSLVEARGLSLRTEIEPNLPRLWVDPTRIRQVLFNLLSNAARFTEQGSVTVSVRHRGEDVTCAVTDTGVGITTEDIPRIFEEFYQLDNTTRRRHGGAGLGLAISQRFVELHGGRIWVESQVGEGSTFYFSLPIRCLEPAYTSANRPDAVTYTLPDRWGEERSLLAVTPSPSAAALLTRYVRGCHAMVVRDLGQAQNAAQQLMPQAVIVDTAYEEFDPAHLHALAQVWELSHTLFLACPLPGKGSLCQRLAVDGYLIKPISRQDLWGMLRQFGKDVDSVLVVDDDRDFVRMLSRMLDSPLHRYEVISAYSGYEGLEMLRYHQPDLVLLDLMLPDIDGAQVIERIRSTPMERHVPIVIISAQDEIDHQEALGGTVFIAKGEGLMPNEIVQWIQEIVDTVIHHRPSPGEENEHLVKSEMMV